MTPERWQRVQQLFVEAADRTPAARALLLERECAGDLELRREVERMLAADEEPEPLLDDMPAALAAATDPAGRRVGPYRILRELGRGGMGAVYLAEREDVGKRVALKLVRGMLAAPENAQRFLLERRVLARLEHPNIATLHDAGVTEDGTPYFAMEYVRGEPIDRYCETHGLGVPERLALFETLCAAVAHAHALRIVHRDLKPNNILVTDPDTFGAGGQVKLLDFGIAKVIEEGAVTQGLTRTGAHPMTPEFAAPEQQAGGPVTPATDVYALGILLERLLGGRPAGEIEPIIRRARASDPERRYASAAELLEELRRVRGGRAPRPPRRRLQLPGRRTLRRPSLLAVALLVLVLAGVAGLLLRQPAEAARADTIAVLPFSYSGSGEHAYLSEGLVSLLSANLDGIDGLRAVEPRALHGIIAQQAGESPSNSALARRLRAALFVAGDILEAGGQLRISAVLHDREGSVLLRATVAGSGEELFTLLQELSARLLAGRLEGGNEQLARNAALTTRSLPALRSYLEGERALRTGQFTAAVDAFDAAVTEDPEFALAHYRLSTAAVWTTRSMLALPSAERALRLAPRLEPIDSLRVVGWHRYLAGDPVWAAHFFHAVTSARPDDVDGWFQLGEVQFHWMPTLGRPATDARAAFERVLEFEPDNAGALIHLVRIAALEGRTAELDSLATRLARIEPGGTRALEARALLAFARRDGAEQQRIAAELRRSDPGRAVPILTLAAAAALDPRGAARWAHELARGPHPERDPAFVLSVLALAAAGRAGDAAAELDAWASVLPQAAHELRAALLLAPLLEPSARQLAAAREALARVPPAQGVLSLPVSDFSPIPQPHVRAYLLGMLSLRLGDASDALAQARRLEAWQGIDRDRRWAREFSRLIRAEMLRRDRRAEEALRLLGPPAVAPDSLLPALLSHPKAHERWLRAELHRELGDDAEALRWYASFPDPIAYDLAYLAPSLLRRAEIHARRGERAQAAAHYRRFLELWRDADPELQPLVIRARRALERE